MIGQTIFPGDSSVDQLVEIIMERVFRTRTSPEAVDLASRLLKYTPSARIRPLQACAHTFFDELREPGEGEYILDRLELFSLSVSCRKKTAKWPRTAAPVQLHRE